MSKKCYFVETKGIATDSWYCDKCGLKIKEVQDGIRFWNPNKRARDKNICRNCFDVISHDKKEKWRIWQEKYAALKNIQEEKEQNNIS